MLLKRLTTSLACLALVLMLSAQVVLAATLSITSVGGVTLGTGTITSVITTKTSPTFIGTAAADATVDIKIDDLTVAATADNDGDWSYTPTGLSEGDHAIELSSNLETISFTLTIDTDSSTTTETSTSSTTTTTKGGVSTSSAELPVSGSVNNTFLVLAAGLFLIGSGVVAHQSLRLDEEE